MDLLASLITFLLARAKTLLSPVGGDPLKTTIFRLLYDAGPFGDPHWLAWAAQEYLRREESDFPLDEGMRFVEAGICLFQVLVLRTSGQDAVSRRNRSWYAEHVNRLRARLVLYELAE